jgi:hypothetical protein
MDRLEKVRKVIALFFNILYLVSGITAIIAENWLSLFIVVLGLLLMFLPSFLEHRLKVDFPSELEIAILLFLIASIYFGEIKDYYFRFWWWDTVLHLLSATMIAMIGFSLIYILNDYKKVKLNLSPFFMVLFVFCFTVALGALWEIFEFSIDQIFGANMQKSGIVDTMWDLIADTVGAFFVCLVGYLYLKGKEFKIVKKYKDKFINQNPQIFNKN